MNSSRSVALLFVIFGIVDASWTSRIPYIRDRLGLSDFELAVALAGPSIGLMTAAWLTPRLVRRFGSPWVARGSAVACSSILVLPGLAHSEAALFLALAVWGVSLGGLDITMNEQGAALERAAGRSRMSGMHATYSIAVLTFAPFGSLATALDVTPAAHFALAAVLVVGLISRGSGALFAGTSEPAPVDDRDTSGRGRRTLIAVSLIGFFGFLSEGAVMNWSGVLLHRDDHASLAVAPLAIAGFSVGMVIGRLSGDRLIERWGHGRVAARAALLAAVGLTGTALLHVPAAAIAADAVVGLGISVLVPIAFAIAARTPNLSPVHGSPASRPPGTPPCSSGPRASACWPRASGCAVRCSAWSPRCSPPRRPRGPRSPRRRARPAYRILPA